MMFQILLVLHIAVLGYWLGAEFVINKTFRYVCLSSNLPFDERTRLLEHVMVIDQHVRYALVLQFILGFTLSSILGYLPGGSTLAFAALTLGVLWLALVETTHQLRHSDSGKLLAAIDRLIRYSLMAGLIAIALLAYIGQLPVPKWLAIKLICFASVMGCGVGIRLVAIQLFKLWEEMGTDGCNEEREAGVRKFYVQATTILILLWVFIVTIVILSIWKPV